MAGSWLRQSGIFTGAALVVCAVSVTAGATEPTAGDRETSRSLGTHGVQALAARDYAAAERACGGAYALVKAPSVGTCWAQALEGLGQLVEARDVFVEVIHLPTRPDEPAVFTSARNVARTEADALAKRIPTVTFAISGPPETTPLRVAIDGALVKSETARLPRKVNPGAHTLSISASGFEPLTTQVTIAEGEDRRLEIPLRPSNGGREPSDVAQSAPTQEPRSTTSGGSLPLPAVVAGGVGLAGLVVGVVGGVAGSAKHSALSNECNAPRGTCPPSAASNLDAFHTLRTVSTVGYVVGGLGLVAGGVLFFAMPTSRQSPTATGLFVGPSSCWLAGEF